MTMTLDEELEDIERMRCEVVAKHRLLISNASGDVAHLLDAIPRTEAAKIARAMLDRYKVKRKKKAEAVARA